MLNVNLVSVKLQVPDIDEVRRLLLQEPPNQGVRVNGLPESCSVFRFEEGPRAGYMGITVAGEFGDWELTHDNLVLAVMRSLPRHPTRFWV
jgi:hypothetical protein